MTLGSTGPAELRGTPVRADLGDERGARALLALALVLGLVRFWRLGAWSLWIDEALTLSDSLHGTSFKNPLGYGLWRFYLDQLAERPSEIGLRLPAALLGWLSLPLTAWAFAPLIGRRAAAGATLLLAVSSWHVYWSQNARFYTLALVLSVLGSGLVLRGLLANRMRLLIGGLAVVGSAGLAHQGAASLLPVWILAPILARFLGHPLPGVRPRTERVLFGLGVVGALAALPWVFGTWATWKAARAANRPTHFLLTVGYFFTPLLGTAAAVGTLLAVRRRQAGSVFCAVVAAVVLLVWLVVGYFARASAQYVFFLLPWVAALSASPLQRSPADPEQGASAPAGSRPGTVPALAWLALLTLTLTADLGLYYTQRGGGRPPWRDAYRYVWNQRDAGDLIFGMEAPVGEYYLDPSRTELRNPVNVTYLNRERSEWLDLWSRRPRRTWYVINREQMNDLRPPDRAELVRILREECRLQKSFELRADARDLSVHVYLRE